jgi:hypothetical protein
LLLVLGGIYRIGITYIFWIEVAQHKQEKSKSRRKRFWKVHKCVTLVGFGYLL